REEFTERVVRAPWYSGANALPYIVAFRSVRPPAGAGRHGRVDRSVRRAYTLRVYTMCIERRKRAPAGRPGHHLSPVKTSPGPTGLPVRRRSRGGPQPPPVSVLLGLVRGRLTGPDHDVSLALEGELHGLAGAAAQHRTQRLRPVQRGREPRGPAHDGVGVDVDRLLRSDRDDQRVAVAHQPQPAVPGEDAVEQAAPGDARALHGADPVRQGGVEAQHVAAVDGEFVTGLDVDDEAVLRLLREPRLAPAAHRHQRQPLAGHGALEHAAHALALAFELQAAAVGDHRALTGEHLAVDRVADALGVLDGHARGRGGLHHVPAGKEVT